MFLGGLSAQSKFMLDTSASGKISLKTPREAIEIIENIASNTNNF